MKILGRMFAPLLLAGAVALVVPGVALADTTIIDGAKVLNTSEVKAAANAVPGADVYVVTLADPGEGVADELKAIGSAAGWDDYNKDWDDNGVIIGMYPSQVTGQSRIEIFYGQDFVSQLQGTYISIIDDDMIPAYKSSGPNAAMLAGLKGVRAALDGGYNDPGGAGSTSSKTSGATIWIVIGVVVLAVVLFVLYGRRKRTKAAAAEKDRLEKLALDNGYQAMQLHQRLDQAKILVGTIADSPAQDVVEADVADVERVLNRRDAEPDLNTDADLDHQNLTTLAAALDSISTRVAILRKDTGWQDMWSNEVATVRSASAQLLSNAQAVRQAKPDLQLNIQPVDDQLSTLQGSVLSGTTPIDRGVQALGEISRGVKTQADAVNAYLASIAEERRQAEAALARQREIDAQNRRGGGGMGGGSGSFWGGMIGGAIGSSMNNRRRGGGGGFGGGFGGGGFGGGGGGGGRSGGGHGGGGGRSF